jgi:hypothetical protein
VRVLIQFEITAAKVEVVLVITWREVLRHTTSLALLIGGLEDNLSGTATQVENSGRRSIIRATNLAEQVVGCDPSIDTFVLAIHDLDTALLLGDNWERIGSFQAATDGIQDFAAHFIAQKTKSSRSLDGNRRAGLVLIGNRLQSDLHKRVQTVGSTLSVFLERAETGARTFHLLGLLENLIFKFWGRAAVVESVDVNTRPGATSIDHKGILNQGLGRVGGLGTFRGRRHAAA